VGFKSLVSNTIGFHNTAVGDFALNDNISGDYNLAAGSFALQKSTGDRNVAVGPVALRDNVTGTRNVALGVDAGQKNTGSDNVFVGFETGRDNTGTGNVFIGRSVGLTATGSNRLMIDNSSTATPLIQGDFNTNVVGINGTMGVGVATTNCRFNVAALAGEDAFRVQIDGGTKLLVHNNGGIMVAANGTPTYGLQLPNIPTQLIGQGVAFAWNTYSDERIKSNIQPLTYGLKELLQLQPKSYDHHASSQDERGLIFFDDGVTTPDLGFIAQEVQRIIPEVVHVPSDENGELWSMDYVRLIPVLVNGIQTLASENERLKARVEVLEERFATSPEMDVNASTKRP
jgi:hypothetical protein